LKIAVSSAVITFNDGFLWSDKRISEFGHDYQFLHKYWIC